MYNVFYYEHTSSTCHQLPWLSLSFLLAQHIPCPCSAHAKESSHPHIWYLCQPLFPQPQMIGESSTQPHYKISTFTIGDLCIRLCVSVAEDAWCYLRVQVFHMCNKGCKSSNPIKTCSHAEIDKSILGENHHSGSWVYLLSLHPRPLPSDHFIISFFKCCDLVPL